MSAGSDYRALARTYRTLPERLVRTGADEIKRSVETQLRSDTGGDFVLSGTLRRRRSKRTRLGVNVRVTGGRSIATAIVGASPPKALGQWGWLQRGTSRREMGKLHMRVGGAWRTGPWDASGSRARSTFTDGVSRGVADAERAIAAEWERSR